MTSVIMALRPGLHTLQWRIQSVASRDDEPIAKTVSVRIAGCNPPIHEVGIASNRISNATVNTFLTLYTTPPVKPCGSRDLASCREALFKVKPMTGD